MTVRPVTHDGVKVRHGFFTREGGISTGIYQGLNCGLGSNDDRDQVVENRNRVATALGTSSLTSVYQIHSPDVAIADQIDPSDPPKADALVTATPGLAIGILTADCTPVLFADPKAGVIGAAHAGWKGAIGGVLENTVDAMIGLGATRDDIMATAGPTISQANYEVGQDFMEQFLAEDPDFARFFANGVQPEKYQFDLPGFVLSRLRAAGVTAEWTGHCTYADEDRFFSYRRTTHRGEPDYGRQISAIML
ncbi:MAG: peptidoglycan editing factor PgeF [Pseudomonadota bacterium]